MAPDDPRFDVGRQRLAEGATRAAAVLDEHAPYRLSACQAELTAWARRLVLL
jgi:hypothetical protein